MVKLSTAVHVWPQLGLRRISLFALLALLVIAFVLSLAIGSVNIPPDNVGRILLGGVPDRATWADIVLKFRLPKALTATLAGAALAVSGLQMQTLFRNPLADPYTLGVSSGASLGVALVILGAGATGTFLLSGISLLGDLGLATAAGIGAALTMLAVLFVANRLQNTVILLILGVMFGYLASALVSLLIYFSLPERIQSFTLWSAGSFAGVTWSQMRIFAPLLVVGLGLAGLLPKSLNALLLGETYARTLGLNVGRARLGIILSASLLAGTVTAFCGPIGFLGVAVPHLCRGIFNTADHRVLVPTTVFLGAIMALLADLIAQLPGSQYVLPLNVVTSLFGVPVIVWVILRQRQMRTAFGGA
ncbi:MAG TPA: iron ABC transporter permease [Caldilineaceae bacterium]|nr:iron ABC transporter permease [Caldilineaceae bacterium]